MIISTVRSSFWTDYLLKTWTNYHFFLLCFSLVKAKDSNRCKILQKWKKTQFSCWTRTEIFFANNFLYMNDKCMFFLLCKSYVNFFSTIRIAKSSATWWPISPNHRSAQVTKNNYHTYTPSQHKKAIIYKWYVQYKAFAFADRITVNWINVCMANIKIETIEIEVDVECVYIWMWNEHECSSGFIR